MAKNTIDFLINSEGVVPEWKDDIAKEVNTFYKGLLGTQESELRGIDPSLLKSSAQFSSSDGVFLIKSVIEGVIRTVHLSMKDHKAPWSGWL